MLADSDMAGCLISWCSLATVGKPFTPCVTGSAVERRIITHRADTAIAASPVLGAGRYNRGVRTRHCFCVPTEFLD